MPHRFDVTAEASVGTHDVTAAFAQESYWLARLAFGDDATTLDSLEVDPGRSIVVRTTQDLRRSMLPPSLGRMLPGNAAITKTESWRTPLDGTSHGEFSIVARGVPSAGSGTMLLQPMSAGSQLRVQGAVHVRIPVVGGQVERFVTDLISRDVLRMHQFTADWIAGRTL